ncbi:MAG: cysteine synthase A [Paracoccaceae bacterium]|jgi:cysteine synthase A
MDIRDGFSDSVGNTPLIKLKKASELTGCTILGKAEFLNPGGSVKDRAALYMILDAERQGTLQPGGVIVEGTAGNTGIGLTLVANARGYRTVIVIPETQSQEKMDMLRLCGAELMPVPAKPYKDPENYVRQSERVAAEYAAKEPSGALWANQWDNPANWQGHYQSTGPEIWAQTDGKVDGFICAMGTGGTLAGISTYLKEQNADVKIGLADPMGAAMYSYYKTGELASEGSSITEGIGQGRITGNVAQAKVDLPFQIADEEALPIVFDLLKDEGLCLGGSSGINVAGAIRLAQELGPGHTIVTVLCDGGQRYQSKLFNPAFLKEKNLPAPDWL